MAQSLKNNNFNNEEVKNAWESIKKANSITLLTHVNPDGDAISACAALELFLESLDIKQIETIYPNHSAHEATTKRKPKNLLVNSHKQIPDLIISLDTATYERFYYPEEFKSIPLINIDHHISNSIRGKYDFVDYNASSSCEILFCLMKQWYEEKITSEIATRILCGILYDSQNFRTQNTTQKTLQTAANLIDLGASLFTLQREIFSNKDPLLISFWGHLLNTIKISKNKKAVWNTITQEELKKRNITTDSLAGFNNFLSLISNVDMTILFYEAEDGKTEVSLRSKTTNVNNLASNFGGGGHKNAAGIQTEKPIKDVEKELINLIESTG